MKLLTGVTVTFCALFQLDGVNVSAVGDTVKRSPPVVTTTLTVTAPVGPLTKNTEYDCAPATPSALLNRSSVAGTMMATAGWSSSVTEPVTTVTFDIAAYTGSRVVGAMALVTVKACTADSAMLSFTACTVTVAPVVQLAAVRTVVDGDTTTLPVAPDTVEVMTTASSGWLCRVRT